MKMILKAALLAATLALPMSANAVLSGRDINGGAVTARDGSGVLDSSAVFLYDDVLNITWLRDANYAKTAGYSGTNADGEMAWATANTWAASLSLGTYTDWRLPKMISSPDDRNSLAGGTDDGSNVRTKSGDPVLYEVGQTVYSEMAHLWYSTLGNLAFYPPGAACCATSQPGWGLNNRGDFQNLQERAYWTELEWAQNRNGAWYFNMGDGSQTVLGKDYPEFGVAVRDGDVLVTPVPEPETYALMLASLAVVGAAARRRKDLGVRS